MDNSIKYIIETYFAFNPMDLETDEKKPKQLLHKDIIAAHINLFPKNVDDLIVSIHRSAVDQHDKTWTDNKHCLNLNHIDVSSIKDFSDLFMNFNKTPYGKIYDNVDITLWNVSNGTNFSNMFKNFKTFDCDLSRWDVSRGETFSGMFWGCSKFNSDLSKWNIERTSNCDSMFRGCKLFNSDLSEWKPVNCIDYENMFKGCKLLNFDISNWEHYHNFYHDDKLIIIDMFANCDSMEVIPKWYKDAEQIFDFLRGKNVSFL